MKIVTVIGARPQFIKAWPVTMALQQAGIEEVVVHTGQHYDYQMSEVFFQELEIPKPNVNLEVGSGPHGRQTGLMMERIESVLLQEKPDWLLVYGDTNSTLAAALAAAKLHVPIAHVEAGLRSFNRKMPEELNRILTDHVSTLLFCPTESSVQNLDREGITAGVHEVGDVMLDALVTARERSRTRSDVLNRLSLKAKSYAVATIHRAENTDSEEQLRNLFTAFADLDVPVVLPIHPRTRNVLESQLPDVLASAKRNLQIIDPLGYLDMVCLTGNARVVLTDSGGLQKEAFWLGVPCITLRTETEWVETVKAGGNIVTGCDAEKIKAAWHHFLNFNFKETNNDASAVASIVSLLHAG